MPNRYAVFIKMIFKLFVQFLLTLFLREEDAEEEVDEEEEAEEDEEEEESDEEEDADETVESLDGGVSDIDDEDELNDNPEDDVCIGCDTPGMLICCDCCPRAYHLHCAKPPLKKVAFSSTSLKAPMCRSHSNCLCSRESQIF